MRTSIRFAALALVSVMHVPAARAQAPAPDRDWSRGTLISGFAGVGVDGSRRGPIFGGTIGWDATPRLSVDGSGTWADYGSGFDGFGASVKARANVAWWGRAVPYVQGGVGLYRASFDRDAPRVPGFYGRRMEGQGARSRTFTDPSIVFGGGFNLSISRTVRLRPDVEIAVVLRDSRRHVVPNYKLHLVYVFEDHPVTPSRTGRAGRR